MDGAPSHSPLQPVQSHTNMGVGLLQVVDASAKRVGHLAQLMNCPNVLQKESILVNNEHVVQLFAIAQGVGP